MVAIKKVICRECDSVVVEGKRLSESGVQILLASRIVLGWFCLVFIPVMRAGGSPTAEIFISQEF